MGLCEPTKGQKWSKRMIISTHRLEERPTCQVWMAAGPGWHKAVSDSGCPGSQQSSSFPCLWLHGQCWAPGSTCSEHFQLLSYSGFWYTQEFKCDSSSWSVKLPRKSCCAAPLLMLVGFPLLSENPWVLPCCGVVWRCPAPTESSIKTALLINVCPDPGTQLVSASLSTSFWFILLNGGHNFTGAMEKFWLHG